MWSMLHGPHIPTDKLILMPDLWASVLSALVHVGRCCLSCTYIKGRLSCHCFEAATYPFGKGRVLAMLPTLERLSLRCMHF